MAGAERREIRVRIDALPADSITIQTINGRKSPYLQRTENGKQRSRRVHKEEPKTLRADIEERKRLQALCCDPAPKAEWPLVLTAFYRAGEALFPSRRRFLRV